MNQRIKELMIKAIYDVDRIYDPIDNPLNEEVSKMYIPDCFAEKFAELIVRECAVPMITQARAMDAHGGYKNNPVEVTAMNLHQGLLKHFGVEE